MELKQISTKAIAIGLIVLEFIILKISFNTTISSYFDKGLGKGIAILLLCTTIIYLGSKVDILLRSRMVLKKKITLIAISSILEIIGFLICCKVINELYSGTSFLAILLFVLVSVLSFIILPILGCVGLTIILYLYKVEVILPKNNPIAQFISSLFPSITGLKQDTQTKRFKKICSKMRMQQEQIAEELEQVSLDYISLGTFKTTGFENTGCVIDFTRHPSIQLDHEMIMMQTNTQRHDYLSNYIQSLKQNDCIENIRDMEQIYYHNNIRYCIEGSQRVLEKINRFERFPLNDKVATKIREEVWALNRIMQEHHNIYLHYIQTRVTQLSEEWFRINSGVLGEELVNKQLDLFEGSIINLKGIRIEVEGNRIENDNIILCNRGIFALEVKNYGSKGKYNIRIEKDGRWSRVYHSGNSVYIQENPTEQNTRHLAFIQRLIKTEMNYDLGNVVPIQGIVVIANNVVDINNESSQLVIRAGNLYNTIMEYPILLSESEIEKIKHIILKREIKHQQYPGLNYDKEIAINLEQVKNLTKYYEDKMEKINEILEGCLEGTYLQLTPLEGRLNKYMVTGESSELSESVMKHIICAILYVTDYIDYLFEVGELPKQYKNLEVGRRESYLLNLINTNNRDELINFYKETIRDMGILTPAGFRIDQLCELEKMICRILAYVIGDELEIRSKYIQCFYELLNVMLIG